MSYWGGLALVERLLEQSEQRRTSAGDGFLSWRRWGNGQTLILVHGGFGSWKHWVRNIEPLSANYEVFAVDLPGLGESDPLSPPVCAENIAQSILNGINELAGEDSRIILAGFSLGAVISAPLIHALGDRIERAILIGSAGVGELWNDATANQRRRKPDATEAELLELMKERLEHTMISKRERIDDAVAALQLTLMQQNRRLFGKPISQSSTVLNLLPSIKDKTTLLWGEFDPYLTPDVRTAVSTMRERVPGADIKIIDDAGHWANFEAADKVNAAIAEF